MPLSASWWASAREIVGDRVIADPAALDPYTHDEYPLATWRVVPEAVVKPATEQEVAALVRLCGREKVPLTVRGGGTGLAGGCVSCPGGIVLSVELLNKVLDVDQSNRTITVQAGVTLHKLYDEVEKMNLYFPPHPGDSGAFVGGLAAANAGGSRAVKYGTVRRFVLGLQVVMADGEIVDLGGKVVKSSIGYDLLDLMIGSEGTLGVITRVTLGLLPPVGSVQTVLAPYATVEDAIGAVPRLLATGVTPCAVEFVDHSVIRCGERLLNRSWPARTGNASLMLILDGRNEDDTDGQAEILGGALEGAGSLDVLITAQKSVQADILAIRSMLYEAIRPQTVEVFDVCVPRGEIAGHVGFVHHLEQELDFSMPTYGHAADGNVHTHCVKAPIHDGLFGEEYPDWEEKTEKARDAIYRDVAGRSGVVSGEHGIGLVKRKYLARSLSAAHLGVLRAIKRALDPQGILNPGKIIEM